MTTVEPFGLTFRVAPTTTGRPWILSTAVYEPHRQVARYAGRPLSELTDAERLMTSGPTETDGKDPLSVDTDPLYD